MAVVCDFKFTEHVKHNSNVLNAIVAVCDLLLAQDMIVTLGKALARCAPSLENFSGVAVERAANVGALKDKGFGPSCYGSAIIRLCGKKQTTNKII